MEAEASARAWVEAWTRGWPAKDPEPIVSRYTEGAVYRSHPFREPHSGGARDYVEWAFSEQESVEFWFGEPVVAGNRAAVEYWAVLVESGRELTIAGSAFLRFAPDGRVEEHRDYWAQAEGRIPPPTGFGR
ncbi:MAG: nuclear transport factor 2 family protein [Actinobacteria bacterium]|nr:MAG: nuclear transport factor 2 family protein [Actinomycetota bacterium]